MDNDRRGSAPSPATMAPDEIATRAFSTTFRGLSEPEVRSFLKRVADELARSQAHERELEHQLSSLRDAPHEAAPLDEGELLDALGEETTKLLRNAREAAKDIRARAEETATRLRAEAQADADRVRGEANELLDTRTSEADAVVAETLARGEAAATERRDEVEAQVQAELADAKSRGRSMVDEARSVRERMLSDLGHRRGLLQAQVAELRAGRDHLLDAYRVVKRTFLEATDALGAVEARFAQSRPAALDPADIEAALRPDDGEAASIELAASIEIELDIDGGIAAVGATDADVTPDADGATVVASEAGDDPVVVGDLFARIRAESASGATGADPATGATAPEPTPDPASGSTATPPEGATPTATEAGSGPVADTQPEPGALERASASLTPLLATAAKRAKRAAQDEQNAVLDALRRHKGTLRADAVLPTTDDQVTSWKAVISEALDGAYLAGAREMGDDDQPIALPTDLATTSAPLLVATLRERLVAAVEHHDPDSAADRVNARYREWKTQELEALLEDVMRGAYARGVFDAAPDDARLHWVLAEPRCCADCADNVLEPVIKGAAFPTGQLHPPAHTGCRCVLQTP